MTDKSDIPFRDTNEKLNRQRDRCIERRYKTGTDTIIVDGTEYRRGVDD